MEALQSKEEEKEGREESDSEEDEYYLQVTARDADADFCSN